MGSQDTSKRSNPTSRKWKTTSFRRIKKQIHCMYASLSSLLSRNICVDACVYVCMYGSTWEDVGQAEKRSERIENAAEELKQKEEEEDGNETGICLQLSVWIFSYA
ncbi:hypothetical protein V6Z11_D05G333200 [Gossypium hirsutum]